MKLTEIVFEFEKTWNFLSLPDIHDTQKKGIKFHRSAKDRDLGIT